MGQEAEIGLRHNQKTKKKGFSHPEMTRGYKGVWVTLPDSEYL
jgi:hypothetical protein